MKLFAKSFLILIKIILIMFFVCGVWLFGMTAHSTIKLARHYDESVLLQSNEIPTVMATVTKTEEHIESDGPDKTKIYISYTYCGKEYKDIFYDIVENPFVKDYTEKPFEVKINPLHPEEEWEEFDGETIVSLVFATLLGVGSSTFAFAIGWIITNHKSSPYWKKHYTADTTTVAEVQKEVHYDCNKKIIAFTIVYVLLMGYVIYTAISGYIQLNTLTTAYMLMGFVVLLTAGFAASLVILKKSSSGIKVTKDYLVREYMSYNSESADDHMWEFQKSGDWRVSPEKYVTKTKQHTTPPNKNYYIALNQKNKIKRIFNTYEFTFAESDITEI